MRSVNGSPSKQPKEVSPRRSDSLNSLYLLGWRWSLGNNPHSNFLPSHGFQDMARLLIAHGVCPNSRMRKQLLWTGTHSSFRCDGRKATLLFDDTLIQFNVQDNLSPMSVLTSKKAASELSTRSILHCSKDKWHTVQPHHKAAFDESNTHTLHLATTVVGSFTPRQNTDRGQHCDQYE